MDSLGSESENNDGYRNGFDPVSIFDRGADRNIKWNVLDSDTTTAIFQTMLKPGITCPREKRHSSSNRYVCLFITVTI